MENHVGFNGLPWAGIEIINTEILKSVKNA